MQEIWLRNILTWVLKLLFKVEVRGLEHFHASGERVVVIANHQSFLDPLLLAVFLPQKPVFAMNTFQARKWYFRPLLKMVEVFRIDPSQPMTTKSVIQRLKSAGKVVIFPEGRITTTGGIMKVYDGTGLILDKTQANVLPVHIEGAQYSKLSQLGGKVKQRWFPRITITFFAPRMLELPATIHGKERRRMAGQWIYDLMTENMFRANFQSRTVLSQLADSSAKFGLNMVIAEDVMRAPLTYRMLFTRVFALARGFKQHIGGRKNIGVLLPTSLGGMLTFLALHKLERVPAMLNFSAGTRNLELACQMAEVDTIITSRAFIVRGKMQPLMEALNAQCRIVYIEDIRKEITAKDKLLSAVEGFFPKVVIGKEIPSPVGGVYGSYPRHCEAEPKQSSVQRLLHGKLPYRYRSAFAGLLRYARKDGGKNSHEPAVILYTSGSEGTPKGVVLSHANLLSNIFQAASRLSFTNKDVLFNALPIFHSFGLTIGTLLPLVLGIRVFHYPSPLHYRIIPELAYDTGASILLGTDTFFRGYASYAHDYDFQSVRLAVAGAEKLKPETRALWAKKFRVNILEGYGVTEASPAIAFNTPIEHEEGTVGRPFPGMECKTEAVEGLSEGGRLLVKGPNVMLGYLRAENPGVLEPAEQWYDTGDIVDIDAQGYIRIKGRARRFAKIGGEMVSLALVEELAAKFWPECAHAAIAVVDERKGEQIILMTESVSLDRVALVQRAQEQGLPEIAIPRKITHMEKLPRLGSGKVDYMSLKEAAA